MKEIKKNNNTSYLNNILNSFQSKKLKDNSIRPAISPDLLPYSFINTNQLNLETPYSFPENEEYENQNDLFLNDNDVNHLNINNKFEEIKYKFAEEPKEKIIAGYENINQTIQNDKQDPNQEENQQKVEVKRETIVSVPNKDKDDSEFKDKDNADIFFNEIQDYKDNKKTAVTDSDNRFITDKHKESNFSIDIADLKDIQSPTDDVKNNYKKSDKNNDNNNHNRLNTKEGNNNTRYFNNKISPSSKPNSKLDENEKKIGNENNLADSKYLNQTIQNDKQDPNQEENQQKVEVKRETIVSVPNKDKDDSEFKDKDNADIFFNEIQDYKDNKKTAVTDSDNRFITDKHKESNFSIDIADLKDIQSPVFPKSNNTSIHKSISHDNNKSSTNYEMDKKTTTVTINIDRIILKGRYSNNVKKIQNQLQNSNSKGLSLNDYLNKRDRGRI